MYPISVIISSIVDCNWISGPNKFLFSFKHHLSIRRWSSTIRALFLSNCIALAIIDWSITTSAAQQVMYVLPVYNDGIRRKQIGQSMYQTFEQVNVRSIVQNHWEKVMDESWYEKMEKHVYIIFEHICVQNILEQNAQNIWANTCANLTDAWYVEKSEALLDFTTLALVGS